MIRSGFTSGSALPRVVLKDLKKLPVSVPPLEVQQSVAFILGSLDDKIEVNRQMNATLEKIGQAIFKHWFVDFEFPNEEGKPYKSNGGEMEDSELGEIPKGWRVRIIGDISINPHTIIKPEAIEPSIPYIGLEHMPRRSIALIDWKQAKDVGSNKFLFQKGDILFGKLRPYFHKVGVASVDGVCSTDILVIAPKQQKWYGFVLFHFSSTEFVNYADATSTGTKMPRTNWTDMAQYKIVLPPENIAQIFTNNILPLIQKIQYNVLQCHKLNDIRDALLPKLMSGEIRVLPKLEEGSSA